jgi:hypothetical protein
MPIAVDGGLISLSGTGRGAIAGLYSTSPAIQARVWTIISPLRIAESADMRRTFGALPLADAGDERLLFGERVATRVVGDLLQSLHG